MLKKIIVMINIFYFSSVSYGSENNVFRSNETLGYQGDSSELTPLISPRPIIPYCPSPSNECCTSLVTTASLCCISGTCGAKGLLASFGCLTCCFLCQSCDNLSDLD